MNHFAELTEQEIEEGLTLSGLTSEEMPESLDELVQLDENRWSTLRALLSSTMPVYA